MLKMQSILVCKYDGCNKFLFEPVFLPCGHNVCKSHIDKLVNSDKTPSIFKCKFCAEDHEIPKDGYQLVKSVIEILNLNLHLSENGRKAVDLINEMKKSATDFESLVNDPENFIFEYISSVRNKIDLERERLLLSIQTISDQLLEKLKKFEEDCQENLKNVKLIQEENKIYILKLEEQMLKWKEELRMPNTNNIKMNKMIQEINVMLNESQEKFLDYENNLLNGRGCIFEPRLFKFTSDLFGKFGLDEFFSPKSTELFKKKDIANSLILTPAQCDDLIKLCGFSCKSTFELIYRASHDGFGSEDFHRNCDGKINTLTIIKEKQFSHVFGGYTEADWEGRDKGEYKHDAKTFIFSLVNKDNHQVKLYPTDESQAIIANPFFGPIFGKEDITIKSNSNVLNTSYSKLGNNFKAPDHLISPAKAPSFLAGSYNFMISEIEVYVVK